MIHFDNVIRIHEPAQFLVEDEEFGSGNGKEQLWYTKNDYDTIREEGAASLRDHGYSRGLELWYDKVYGGSQSQQRRTNQVQSLLALQEDHKEEGLRDAKGLRALSVTLSKQATKQAQQRAAQDSMEAFQVHTKEETKSPCYPYMHILKATNAKEYARKTSPQRSRARLDTTLSCC
ncbi:expressed unknown protein [Seminavis robusta]|uniref:Uncharacterized protein n=1 Tax=Seminavis robusta TaxID=568900 RepID=A0A9N8DNF1_9STRA|nr:expressed unknown protein [Seminavis robusta]|eukprot:Sro258_g101110.1 n/a (176) ;mRNA; r:37536-38063